MFLRFINILVLVISLKGFSQEAGTSFKAGQMKYERVKKAYSTKYEGLKKEIAAAGFVLNKFEIYLRIFKQERELQVWMKNKEDAKFKLFKTYPICASSGDLGPKRKEGDGQVPEGFYEIESFNPVSSYHLSMKVNYPNKSDLKKATGRPGGDIMIHGNCVTIGCIPIENDPIEELYILSVDSRDRKNKLEVDIYPCKFSVENIKVLSDDYSKELNSFWATLKETYFYFEKNQLIPNVVIDKNGNYEFKK
jgi:murein L,D-transpeptidase YafK